MIRALEPRDVVELKEIHDKFFKDEFTFPDFFRGFLCCFTVIDDSDDSIICVGAVRPIAEVFAITNKDKNPRTRRNALYQILDASAYMAGKYNFDQIHCFVQDALWESQLIRAGFNRTKGNSLFLNI